MSNTFLNKSIFSSFKRLFRMRKYLSRKFTKKKTDLIEMIVYGCITEELNKKEVEDISIKQPNHILNKSNIIIFTRIWKCSIKEKRNQTIC